MIYQPDFCTATNAHVEVLVFNLHFYFEILPNRLECDLLRMSTFFYKNMHNVFLLYVLVKGTRLQV